MDWLDKMLHRPARTPPPPPISDVDHDALDAAKVEHRRLLNRADEAIKEAMAHADKVFTPKYRGPERRRVPR